MWAPPGGETLTLHPALWLPLLDPSAAARGAQKRGANPASPPAPHAVSLREHVSASGASWKSSLQTAGCLRQKAFRLGRSVSGEREDAKRCGWTVGDEAR